LLLDRILSKSLSVFGLASLKENEFIRLQSREVHSEVIFKGIPRKEKIIGSMQ
jgi:hypothetical protein